LCVSFTSAPYVLIVDSIVASQFLPAGEQVADADDALQQHRMVSAHLVLDALKAPEHRTRTAQHFWIAVFEAP
jgi:hypothetical protein